MCLFIKNHKIILLISICIILFGCKLQEPIKNHGIVFLKNRSDQLIIKKFNKNDVISIMGNPHTKSLANEDKWIYVERVLTKGSFHKLGQNILKENNVLILTFDKYGILNEKNFLDQNKLEKLSFSEKTTVNDLSKKSFVEKFLSSIKAKMYGNRK
tara:strand:+ start:348 stop:815 length:468 start_codon:yes stop_codon:yes gene_type:complete